MWTLRARANGITEAPRCEMWSCSPDCACADVTPSIATAQVARPRSGAMDCAPDSRGGRLSGRGAVTLAYVGTQRASERRGDRRRPGPDVGGQHEAGATACSFNIRLI